jgi:hypothetical protein
VGREEFGVRACSLIGATLLLIGTTAMPALGHGPRSLGDGRLSSAPRADYLFSCQQRFNPNAPGADVTGPWIHGDTYDPDQKPVVGGAVTWPNARIEVTIEGDVRVVRANNLPTHPTGIFPIRRDDPAWRYDHNPNRIREQDILLRLPVVPEAAATPSCVPMGMVGFTLVGGALYNALDARGRDAAAHEILDQCGGHPQQQGQYHYHDAAPCLPAGVDESGHSVLIGYALDGFGIYGPKDVGGALVTNNDLDACHGHVGPVMWDGVRTEIYHYHLNDEYPYSIGCFHGAPVQVALRQGPRDQLGARPPRGPGRGQAGRPLAGLPPRQPGGGPLAGPRGGPGGADPIAAVARDLNLDPEALRRAVGPPPPDIERAARELGVDPQQLRAAFARYRPG